MQIATSSSAVAASLTPQPPSDLARGTLNFHGKSYTISYTQHPPDIEERKLVRRIFEHVVQRAVATLPQDEELNVAIEKSGESFVVNIRSRAGNCQSTQYSRDEIFDSLQTQLRPLAVAAHQVYFPRLPETEQRITHIFGAFGRIAARAKSPISAANRLARTLLAPWGAEQRITTVQDAVENLWDAIGTRVILRTGNDPEVDQLVKSLIDAITDGSLSISRMTNLRGPHGLPYFSDSHIDSIKGADDAYRLTQGPPTSEPMSLDIKERSKGSPFTCVCIYVRLGGGVTGEIQILGPKVLELANAEHIPYDALIHKDLDRRLNAEGKVRMAAHFKIFLGSIAKLTPSQKTEYEHDYLNACYIHARRIEKGLAQPEEAVPFPPNLRGLPELSMENILKLEHEYERVLEETKRGSHGTS